MSDIRRHLAFLALVAVIALSRTAGAWLETAIQSDDVTLELSRDGTAVVAHELLLRVRGGPLKSYRVAGVDPDADPLPDAVVSAARTGPGAARAIPLVPTVSQDGTLNLVLDHPRGVWRGVYLLRFRYRTDLLGRDQLRRQGAAVQVRWVGPRFEDGIDSARTVLRVPRAPNPPRIPEASGDVAVAEEFDGVFLSNLRRGPDFDELEIVRPHVAKGEPVVWRAVVDPKTLDAFAETPPSPAVLKPQRTESVPAGARIAALAVLAALALAYALVTAVKARLVAAAGGLTGARSRSLLPLPVAIRSAVAGVALAGAVACALFTEHPAAAAASLVVAMLCAAHRSPEILPAVRGPGRWLPLSDADVLDRDAVQAVRLPGGWLDAGRPFGLVLFAGLVAGLTVIAPRLLALSLYPGVLLALGAGALVPIFCTGRLAELPRDPAVRPRRALRRLARGLRRDRALKVVAWGRIPDGGRDPDELRLRVLPRRALGGLLGIEVAFEYRRAAGCTVPTPCVLVRVLDGSASYRSMPRSLLWTRGRQSSERVAVLRPKLPTESMCLALVRRVGRALSAPARPLTPRAAGGLPPRVRRPSHVGRPIRIPIEGGSGSLTAKPATSSSPAHAT